jgi:hypothetical protein
VNKTLLLDAITAKLRENFENLQNSSKKTRSTGNDTESKSEGKYDTRSTEENYLADGFAKQALAAAQSATICQNLTLLSFTAQTPIAVSALVKVAFPDEKLWFFLAPAGGGTEVICEGIPITVLTPESPLGAQLIGLKVGDSTQSPKIKVLAVE